MKQSTKWFMFTIMIMFLLAGCKVQNIDGPYQKATEKIKIDNLDILEDGDFVSPTPNKVVRTIQPIETLTGSTESETFTSEVENIESKEIRTEKFDLIEDQDNSRLKKFNVVIGSFSKKENAKKLQRQMTPSYSPIIVVNRNGMYRVILASYGIYSDALNKKYEIKSQFPDTWILSQKK